MFSLSSNDINLMRLVRKDSKEGGWAKVSKAVWPLLSDLPIELVEMEKAEDGGRIRLTDQGNTILDWN